MPKILMKLSVPGSNDGITQMLFKKDLEYDVSNELAKAFVEYMEVATYIRTRIEPEPEERAVIEKAPEIKDHKIVKEIKDLKLKDEKKIEEKPKKIVRVFQLADELGMSSKEVINVAKKLGIFVNKPASGLSDKEVEKIKADLN